MTDTVETDNPLTFRDKKALLASDVEVRSFLVEEPTWTSPVDLPSGVRQSAVFANPFKQGVHEVAYVEPDGTLVHLARSSDSTTGWAPVVVSPGTFTQVVSTIHPDGSVWLFGLGRVAGMAQAMSGFRLDEERGWIFLCSEALGGTAQIYAGLGPDGGPRISGSGSVAVNGSGTWELAPVSTENGWEAKPLQHGAQPNAVDWVVGYDRWGNQRTYSLVPRADAAGGELILSYGPGTWSITGDAGTLAGPYLTQVKGLPVLDGVFYVTHKLRSLAVAWALAGELQHIPMDRTWGQVSVHNDDQGQLTVVGASDGVVRVARQTGSAPGPWEYSVPTFEPFGPSTVGLSFTAAAGVAGFAVDRSASSRLAIATWGGSESSRLHTHDLRFGWRDEPLRLPADIGLADECLVTHYVADAYVRNGIGAPMQVVPVGLSADIPIQVEVQGQQVVLGPDATVSTFTDVFGKVTFRLPATALDTPLIHLSALGLGQGASVNLAECVQDFLGGDAAIAAVPSGLTDEVLAGAEVGGQALINFEDAPIRAEQVVAECHRAFARPTYEGTGIVEIDGDRSRSRTQTPPVSHSTNASQDDLLQGFRCGDPSIQSLEFAVDSREAAVEIAPIASITVPLLLDSSEYAPRVLECLFWWCGASTTDLLTWMTSTIDFTQTWNTVKAMEAMTDPLLQWQAAAATYFGSKIKPGVFDQALGTLAEGLAQAQQQVGGRSVPQLMPTHGDSFGDGQQLRGALSEVKDVSELIDSPHGRWIFERVLYSKAGAPPPDLPDTYDILPDVSNLLDGFRSGEVAETFAALVPDVVHGLIGSDPSTFGLRPADTGFSDVDALLPSLLAACEGVAPSIAGILGKSAPVLTQTLGTSAGAGPELTAVFEWLQLRAGVPSSDVVPLTLLRAGFLVIAIPVNLACHRAMGQYPFPTGQAPQIPLPPDGSPGAASPIGDMDTWLAICITMQLAAASTQLVWVWMNIAVDFLGMDFGRAAPFFPAIGDPGRVLRIFVIFEVIAFLGIGCPAFWGYLTFTPGKEDSGWWGQWILQTIQGIVDFVLVFWGELIPGGKQTLLAMEGKVGCVIMTAINLLLTGLAGWTYSVSEMVRVDTIWLWNRIGAYLPGFLAPLRYYTILQLEEHHDLRGAGVYVFNTKVYFTIGANLMCAGIELYFPLNELLNPPELPAVTLPHGSLDKPYEQGTPMSPHGGLEPYSGWTVVSGRLPNGTSLAPSADGSTCVLVGTPTEVGMFSFEVAVTDYFAPAVTVKQSFSLNVTATVDELV